MQAPNQQDDLPYWLVAVLASLGALQTGYLTWVMLFCSLHPFQLQYLGLHSKDLDVTELSSGHLPKEHANRIKFRAIFGFKPMWALPAIGVCDGARLYPAAMLKDSLISSASGL